MRTYTEEELSNPSQELMTFLYANVKEMENFNNQLRAFMTGSL